MGFDIFKPADKNDIRVGYISTDRGYIQGASICEANSYAQLNPGTTFIIKNRKRIEYKNINEVNKLKPVDVFVPAENKCGGIQLNKPCGPVRAEFYGGGGVGVKGNPVIGKDGSLMAIHMVSRGHGYQYPPLVDIIDDCSNRGAGAVARVLNIGETAIKTEVYSSKEEFEEYFPPEIKQICSVETAEIDVGHGRRYSPDGKDIGPWDPSMYVSDEEDPIRRQIAQFQEYLAALSDPWWFVRKEAPLQVTSDNEEGFIKRQKKLNFNPNRIVYPVQHHAWGGSLLTHGKVKKVPGQIVYEEEIFDIYTQGGHGRGLQFTFTEIGGDTVFVVKADDYTDGGEPRSITKQIKPNVDYKVTSQGAHGIRNVETGTEQGLLRKNFGSRGKEKGLGTSSMIFADLIGTNNDNDDLQILAKKGKFKSANKTKRDGHSNYDLTYRLTVPAGGTETASSQDATTRDVVEIARSFMNDHAISPVPMSNAAGSDFAGMLFTMEWEEEFPYPGEYTFKAQCDNVASFYLDGQQEIAKIATWKDKPTVIKKNLNWEDSDKKGKVYKMRLDLLNALQYKDLHIQQPPQKDSSDAPQYEEIATATAKFEGTTINDLALVVSGAGTAECTLLLDTNDKWSTSGLAVREMRCGSITLTRSKGRRRETLTGTGLFPAGRHPIEIIGASSGAGARIVSSTVRGHDSAGLFKREGISTSGIADTRIELDDNISNNFDRNASINLRVKSIKPEKRRLKPPAKPKTAPTISGIKVQKVFNTVDWMNKANRQLWRTNVANRGGFINSAGVCPFNTNLELDTNPYAGTHAIKWANVNFPIDGNYIIKAAVDDAVTLTFRGPSGETVIRKEGFSTRGDGTTHTGTSTYTRFFKKGNYTLDADLEQIPGGRFGFRKDKGKTVKDKEVSFKVTTAAYYGNTITIPGLFSVGKVKGKTNNINEHLIKNVEVGKEYDVILKSNEGTERLRLKDNGRRLEMEDLSRGDSWDDLVCTVTEGQFYSVQGNRCKFRLGETIKGLNPMSLAVDIEVAYATKTVVSARSWQENPMGVAFTIKAPHPPVPVEKAPKQKGRCPNNPMWTTRFPSVGGNTSTRTAGGSSSSGLRGMIKAWYSQRWIGRVASEKEVDDWIGTGKSANDIRKGILGHLADSAGIIEEGSGSGSVKVVTGGQWYPVRMEKDFAKAAGHRGGWSQFLNRWAVSPVLPLPHKGTDEGGKVFTNTWNIDVPYDGFYELKGEVDDIARYYIDGDLKLDLSRRRKEPIPGTNKFVTDGSSKFRLTAGLKKLTVEVENYSTVTYKEVSKKVFSARDWRRQAPVAPPPSGQGGILCHAGGGKGGTDNQEQLVGGKVIVGKGGDGGKGGDDNQYDRHHGGTGGGAGLRSGGNSQNPLTHSQIDSMSAGRYKGGPGGFGVNFTGSAVGAIQQTLSSQESSGGNGVAMGGGGGGNCRGGKGGNGGNGGVKITWGLTGKSQEWTSPGVYNVTVPGGIGKVGQTGSGAVVTAKFEGNNINDLALVVSGTGTVECTLLLDTNDNYGAGHSVTEMRCGEIILKRTNLRRRTETLVGTGTFVGGKRYPIQIIETGRSTGARIVSSNVSGHDSASLFKRENLSTKGIADTRIELDDDAVGGFDRNASINLRVSPEQEQERLDGVTIVCIGGGGSGYMDGGGDRQGSGGSGGAYAWVNKDIKAGKKLKVVVGKGGIGKNVEGAERGGDSYVKVMAEPPPSNPIKIIEQQKGKVSYSGPNLFHFTDKRWGKVMNKFGVSPANVDTNLDKPSPDNVGTKILEWKNVDFPLKGQYDVLFAADNTASLFINGEPLLSAKDNYTLSSDKIYDKINIGTPGRYDIKIELFNAYHGHAEDRTHANDDVFRHNPSGVVLEIRKDVNVRTDAGKSWIENPMGVSGILIPPPCPKEVGGKGVVPDPVIDDPGNGYVPLPEDPGEVQYPVVIKLDSVRVEKKGINYDCSKDKVIMNPDVGYKMIPKCGPFGTIEEITLIPPDPSLGPPFAPGLTAPGLTGTPEIFIDSATGINAQLKPVLVPEVVPPDVLPPDQILQVTDLAGIKQTGYYNGKPYYGAIYYENGIKYAGWYETAGQLIQIYDTLQESIDAEVTTSPSAIQRQGSDVTSNDPRLNIPGTPENLT